MSPVWFKGTRILDPEALEEKKDSFQAIMKLVAQQVFKTANFVVLKGTDTVMMAGPGAFITLTIDSNGVVSIHGRLTSPMEILRLAKVLKLKPSDLVLTHHP